MRALKPWTDLEMDNVIGVILRTGVIVSALIVLGGGILYLQRHGFSQPDYRVFHGEPFDLRTIPGIIRDALALQSRGIIQFGVLLLIATPVLRVTFTIIAFALQRDRVYLTVTSIVLAVLLFGLTGAAR